MNRTLPLALSTLLAGAAALTIGSSSAVAQISPDEADAAKIMAAVENRDEGDKTASTMTMSIKDSAGRERTRTVKSWSIRVEGAKPARKQLILFAEPADVANTGMLSFDYDDGGLDDDQWLYLPSLKKSTRISSGDKSGSFMGSDLSYADMTRADPAHYEYRIETQSAPVKGEDCWLIEAKPKTKKARDETGYIKTHVWVSKSKLLPLQSKSWVREGKKLKYMVFGDIRQVAGIWTPHKIMARTKKGKQTLSQTVLQFTQLTHNSKGVTPGLMTQGRLEQGL